MNRKKLLCILLAAATAFCNFPVTDARAQSPVAEQQEETRGTRESKGNGAEFQIENGVLVKYTGDGGDVVIPEGVTSIGDCAFQGCDNLASVIIPEGVSSIGWSAFYHCSGLTSVTIPKSVGSIGNEAFCGCSGLTDITIPEGVTSIGHYAFGGCSGLTDIVIPASASIIWDNAFNDCSSLEHITVADGNQTYDSRNDCNAIIETEKNCLIRGCKNTSIPEGITSIGDSAFSYCSNLISITIPEGVTSIEWGAFSNCSGLESITIPKGVSSIEGSVFSYCSNLTSVTIPEGVSSIGRSAFENCVSLASIEIPENVSSIGIDAFYGCSSLKSIEIPEGVSSIERSAFYGCSSLEHITIPEGVSSIEDSVFKNCSSLKSIEIPKGVNSIGRFGKYDDAFFGCSSLERITVASGNQTYDSRNDCNAIIETESNCLVFGCKNTSIPEGVSSIGQNAFSGCSGLADITIPESVTSIERDAFSGCSGLADITIPESVTRIGDHAFSGCSGLADITIPKNVTSIANSTFSKCSSLASVTISEGVSSIDESAFYGCSSLASITIPEGVSSISNGAFSGCSSLERITVASGNQAYDSRNDCNAIIETESNRLVCGCKNTSIPENVSSIGNDAFFGCSGLTGIEIPRGVTSIGHRAFRGCSSLAGIEIPGGVTSIGVEAFYECSSLTGIEIPESVTSIESDTFSKCSSLERVTVAGGNKIYDSRNDCNAIIETESNCLIFGCKNTSIPKGISSIGVKAFYGCSGLTSITIPEGVSSIDDGAFYGCSSLAVIEIPESVTDIGSDGGWAVFSNCHEDFTLLVIAGSYAETYAKDNNIPYRYANGGAHTHSYVTTISAASIGKDGSVTKTCTKCGEKITETIYAPKTISLSKTEGTYNGKRHKPNVAVKDSKGKVLSSKTDYTISYPKTMKNVGSYTVAINFKGNYSGTAKKTFTIVPQGTSISKATPKKKGFTVKWKKQAVQTTGYEVVYSMDSKFSKKNTKIVPVKKNGTTSKSIGKLKAKKKYYVRIRTYKTVKGKKYYSEWSKVKNVTVKK